MKKTLRLIVIAVLGHSLSPPALKVIISLIMAFKPTLQLSWQWVGNKLAGPIKRHPDSLSSKSEKQRCDDSIVLLWQ
jgi:hypothetical protein